MAVTLSGNISQVPTSGGTTNLNNTFIHVLDDVILSANAIVDTSMYCRTLNIENGVTFGASDANGVTNRVIVYTYGNLQGWGGFANYGWPGRSIIKFQGECTLKNVTFIYKGGQGTEIFQGSTDWNNSPPYENFSWGYDGSVFGDLDTDSSAVSIENVELICPSTFATNIGYWGTGSELQVQATAINGLFIRNIYGVIFTSNPTSAANIKVINSAWGVVARQTNLVVSGLVSENCAIQLNSIMTLKDSQVSVLRWKKQNNLLTGGYKFQRTFSIGIQGANDFVQVSCFSPLGTEFSVVSSSLGSVPPQIIEWGYISRGSAGKVDNQDTSATNNKLTYAEAVPSKFVFYKLPLDFVFSGYKVHKQWIRISEINYTLASNLASQQLLPVMIADAAVSQMNSAVVASYTSIASLEQLYDALKLYSATNVKFPSLSDSVAWADGTALNLRATSLILDVTATVAISVNQNTNTVTVKPAGNFVDSVKFLSVKTTGTVTAINGATITFPYQSSAGISFQIITVSGARLWIRSVTPGTEIFVSANNTGVAVVLLQPGSYVVRADAYLHHRSLDTEFTAAQFTLRLPLEPYKTKAGVTITAGSLNYVPEESALVRAAWAENKFYFTYSTNHPAISANSLLHAIELAQSGQSATPGTTDAGLKSNYFIKYVNDEFVFDADTPLRFEGEPSNPIMERPYVRAFLVHLGQESPRLLLSTAQGRGIDLPNSPVVTVQASVSGGFLADDRARLQSTLISTDARLNELSKLDVPVSSRATPADVVVSISGGFLAEDRARLNTIPSDTASAVMSAPVEAGWSVRRLLRLIGAVLGGRLSGSPSAPVFKRLGNSGTAYPSESTAITAQVDIDGNRQLVNYELPPD